MKCSLMEQNNNQQKFYLIIILIVFFIFLITGLILLMIDKPFKKTQEINQTKKEDNLQEGRSLIEVRNTKGNLRIVGEENQTLEKNFYLDIIASSDGENITAFDVILNYDQESLEFIKAESLENNFDVFVKKYSVLFLTSGKKTNQITIFNNQPVIRLYFKGKKTGEYFIELLSKKDNFTTKFVNDKTKVIYPESNSLIGLKIK